MADSSVFSARPSSTAVTVICTATSQLLASKVMVPVAASKRGSALDTVTCPSVATVTTTLPDVTGLPSFTV